MKLQQNNQQWQAIHTTALVFCLSLIVLSAPDLIRRPAHLQRSSTW